jgi:hypothetical protein
MILKLLRAVPDLYALAVSSKGNRMNEGNHEKQRF